MKSPVLLVASLFSLTVYAAVPGFIPYSGRLTDGALAGASTTANLRVLLYTCACPSDATLDETTCTTATRCAAGQTGLYFEGLHPNVPIVDGYFTVNLGMCDAQGECDPNPANATFPTALPPQAWLGVAVAGGPELAPRQAIGSVPYAVTAGQLVTPDSYVRNQATPPQSASFNIAGSGYFGGNVGIGTTSPSQKLTVVNGSIKVETTNPGEAGVLLKTPTSDWIVMANDGWAGGDIVFYNNETSKPAVRISEAGTVTMLGACDDVGSGQCANDVAESFEAVEAVEPGDVVALDPSGFKAIGLASKPYDPLAVGVVSTAPTLTMGSTHGLSDVPVALAGVVPVKASLENGPIQPGDLLTSSSTPGLAMRATRPGPIVGKAMSTVGTDGRVWALIGGSGSGCQDAGDLRVEVKTLTMHLEVQRQAIEALRAEVETLKAER